uniref:Uncharacterized protein n=1 Tax=Tanacetum cinerariifolium TaxID=118510 RepID=A0A699J3W9_TANCI|nr:hypothetical protein [Tanacetum cinerariifolium]
MDAYPSLLLLRIIKVSSPKGIRTILHHKYSWHANSTEYLVSMVDGMMLLKELTHRRKSFAMSNNVDKGRKTRVKSINGVHDQVFVTYVAAKVFKTIRHGSNLGQVSSHIGRPNLQTTIEMQHDVDGLVDQNIPNRGKCNNFLTSI